MADLIPRCSCPLCAGKILFGGDSLDAGSTSLSLPPPQPVVAYPYTGDYRIDTLLLGTDQAFGTAFAGQSALQFRWNNTLPLGTPPQNPITYSFMSAKPVYGGTDDGQGDVGFSAFTEPEKAAVRQIMAHLQTELGIRLVEVSDSAFSYGQIRLGNNFQQYSAGYTWLPFSTGDDRSGDVWIDQRVATSASGLAPGTVAWATLVHEIGHALGLKHPGDYNAGSAPTGTPGNYLGVAEDNTNYTIMSYRDAAGGQERDWYGMYDLLALKALYGSGTPNAGDTTYRYDDSEGRVLGIIDDSGGFDTLDVSALTHGATVDLRPGGFSSVGSIGGVAAVNNLSISLSTIIEKFVGTPFGDFVIGNDAANTLFLGGGANVADGGAGIDIALYAGSRSAFQVTVSGSSAHVTGPGISDSLTNIERLGFTDCDLALDLGGAAGIAAKILGAVFGPRSVTDRPDVVGIGLSLLDSGMTYQGLMQVALNAAHVSGASDHAALVDLLYFDIVGVLPGPQELASYKAMLDAGTFTEAQFAVIAADTPQNLANIDLVGISLRGLTYT